MVKRGWPSLGLIWVKDEPEDAEEVGVVEEPVVSGGEEEGRVGFDLSVKDEPDAEEECC